MNNTYRSILICILLIMIIFRVAQLPASAQTAKPGHKYYIHLGGKDSNPGTAQLPWKSLSAISRIQLRAGDAIYLQGGQVFRGFIRLKSGDSGSRAQPFSISSYGQGRAIIDAGDETAITAESNAWMRIENLVLKGTGRKKGNHGRGIWVNNSRQVVINNIEISGFQKSGLELTDCQDASLQQINAHDNGYAGISVSGSQYPVLTNQRIYIGHCKVSNNPGDPTELNNHSGNGIVVGLARHVLIEYCMATANGWDMPRVGNGPVGIWAWEADSLIIQHCIAYRNRTAKGAADGGGFDLDGGVTNSIVQYNLAYENEGYGFGVFQFSGATPWHHNTYRYNISFDDGNTTQNGASILWWNGSKDSAQFHDGYFYHNLLYNSKGYVLGMVPNENENSRFFFLNNIFVGKDELVSGGQLHSELFYGNDWWSLHSGFKVNGITDFRQWASNPGKENMDHIITGFNIDPLIAKAVSPAITDPGQLKNFIGLQLSGASPLRDKGLDLLTLFQLNPGSMDFYGHPIPQGKAAEPGMAELK